MKKRTLLRILALFCCAVMLVSCQTITPPSTSLPTTDTTENVPPQATVDTNSHKYAYYQRRLAYEDGYLYFTTLHNQKVLPYDGVVGPFVRYNIETGNVTYVCPDPLCMHNTIDCPFAGDFTEFAVIDNKVLYFKKTAELNMSSEQKIQTTGSYCLFDMHNMKYSVLLEYSGIDMPRTFFYRLLYHKDIWYSSDWGYNEETGETFKRIQRLNTKTGKADLLNDKDFIYEDMLFILNDRIYFSDAKSIFSTDLNLTDKIVHIEDRLVNGMFETNGENVFYGEVNSRTLSDVKISFSNLYSYHLQTGEKTDLEIQTDPDQWFITDKYIYYMPVEPSGVKGAISPYDSSSVWRCRHDGTEKEKVFDLYRYEEGAKLPSIIFWLWDPVVVDDVMYSVFGKWEDLNTNGEFDPDETKGFQTKTPEDFRLLKMDLKTNTYEIIYPMQ